MNLKMEMLNPEDRNSGLYHLNAILPGISWLKEIYQVQDELIAVLMRLREYKYFIYQRKNPFLQDRAYYFPYKLDFDELNRAANYC